MAEPSFDMDRIIRCDCGGDHFLSLRATRWDDGGDEDEFLGLLEFNMGAYSKPKLDRVKCAVEIIRTGGCILNDYYIDRDIAVKIRDALNEFIDECDKDS